MANDLDLDGDAQDMAEVYDETNITEDGEDIAHPDIERDVYDVTAAEDDAEDDEFSDDDDFDPDQADDSELDTMMEADDGIDSPRSLGRDISDVVTATEESPTEYESDRNHGEDMPGVTSGDPPSPKEQRDLDHGLEETFPASDPVSISPGAD